MFIGYKFLNLDDCWEANQRDQNGRLTGDPQNFPSGMKSLGEYIHGLGLKYGIYSSAGIKTCANRPASLFNEKIDAETFASWGVDFLKYDNCYNTGLSGKIRYKTMHDALLSTGKSIVYSVCQWGEDDPASWVPSYAQSWRTTGDIKDSYFIAHDIILHNDLSAGFQYRGAYNDPDMLEVGNGHMSSVEYETHFSLWAISKAPLLIGCDITKMSEDTKRILMNREVIAVNQDPLGVQGRLIISESVPTMTDRAVLVRPCTNNPEQQWKVHVDGTIRQPLQPGSPASFEQCLHSPDDLGQLIFARKCDENSQKWNIEEVGTRILISRRDKPTECIRVWNDGLWNGPAVVLASCKREIFQAFNYTDGLYFRWTGVLHAHLPPAKRSNSGCLSVDSQNAREVWFGPLANEQYVAVLHNRGLAPTKLSFSFSRAGLSHMTEWIVRDLWRHQDLGHFRSEFTENLNPHSSIMITLRKP